MKKHILKLYLFIFLFQPCPSLAQSPDTPLDAETYEQLAPPSPLSDADKASLLSKKKLNMSDALNLTRDYNAEFKARLSELPLVAAEAKVSTLPQSPQLDWAMRVPVDSPESRVAHDLSLTQDVMDLVQRPLRRQIGQQNYQSKQWEVRSDLFKIASQVKMAYFRYQAALQLGSFYKKMLSAAQASAQLAAGQKEAGNISELDEAQNKTLLKMTELESKKNSYELMQARVALAKAIGISVEESWQIASKLPALPERDPPLASLKQWAQKNHPNLMASRQEIKAGQSQIDLAKRKILPRLDVGVDAEWDAEGSFGVGPKIGMGLPLFGHRKAAVTKAQAELSVSEQKLAALQQGLSYDLDEVYQRLKAAREIFTFYRKQVLPLQQNILDESLKHYNYMLLGNYELLQAKQNQLVAHKNMIEAQRDYWIAYAELEAIAGTFLEKIPIQNEIPNTRQP